MPSYDIGKFTGEFREISSVNLMAILKVIVAQTDSKYGINAYKAIYLFYFRPYFNVQFTMK